MHHRGGMSEAVMRLEDQAGSVGVQQLKIVCQIGF
jgi:hypothetical protein